jgi:hypothetical protein
MRIIFFMRIYILWWSPIDKMDLRHLGRQKAEGGSSEWKVRNVRYR